jgi:type II secretory pathway pseudopilin PulG
MRRFTLLELVIVLAVMATLAALAIPQLYGMSLRARRAEVYVDVDGIRNAELAYAHAYDDYLFIGQQNPPLAPGRAAQRWTTGTLFDVLGFEPDGAVFGSYRVFTPAINWSSWCTWPEDPAGSAGFEVAAEMNLDGDDHRPGFVADERRQIRFCMCIQHADVEDGEGGVF